MLSSRNTERVCTGARGAVETVGTSPASSASTTSDEVRSPVARVWLNHPVQLPVYDKVARYRRQPSEGPPMVVLSGGSGAHGLAQELVRVTHNTAHVLPMFDDGGSSRELRIAFGMPPPGDLRKRMIAISDRSRAGNAEVGRLFQSRLPAEADPAELRRLLAEFAFERHPQMQRLERRFRRIVSAHLQRFRDSLPADFDLRRGCIGNFVICGAHLALGDLESVIFEFSQLVAAQGEVILGCLGSSYHLRADLADGSSWVGQSRITSDPHPPITRLSIVEQRDGAWVEVRPELNPLAERAIRRSSLIAYGMGSFYTSLVPNLIIDGMARTIRETKRPKVFIANLERDRETPGIKVSDMIRELHRYLRESDDRPGELHDYVNYVMVDRPAGDATGERIPVDLAELRSIGVEPIELPLERQPGVHDGRLVAATLVSLC